MTAGRAIVRPAVRFSMFVRRTGLAPTTPADTQRSHPEQREEREERQERGRVGSFCRSADTGLGQRRHAARAVARRGAGTGGGRAARASATTAAGLAGVTSTAAGTGPIR